MKKQKETFYFFHITDAASFKTALQSYIPQITSTATLISPASAQPLAFVNIGFSQTGLTTLGITDNLGDAQFSSGQYADAENLEDDISLWETPFQGTNIHGVFLIGSDQVNFCVVHNHMLLIFYVGRRLTSVSTPTISHRHLEARYQRSTKSMVQLDLAPRLVMSVSNFDPSATAYLSLILATSRFWLLRWHIEPRGARLCDNCTTWSDCCSPGDNSLQSPR